MESSREQEAFSLVKRAKNLTHALRGLRVLIQTTPNVWVHFGSALLAIIFGFLFSISSTEWLFLVLSIGLVIGAEAFNSAIEVDIDLTSPEYHPFARDTKDLAAGAVLIMGITTWIIGAIIFFPKIHAYFFS